MKILYSLIAIILILITHAAQAQHEHHMPVDSAKSQHKHHMPIDSAQAQQGHMSHGGPMSHSFSKNLPMNRNGSGTGWLPDAAPMYGYMYHSKKWMYMLHGNLFLRYTNHDIRNKGSRGGSKFDAPNWVMGMGQRPVGKNGLFRFSAMLSLDRLTVGGAGYPLLFQSGETWKGVPLVDKQHPHDLFSELSVGYSHAFSKDMDLFAYIGYPGEPALGPVAFMHRVSSLYNPDAPLGHHWQDATHITFGVTTVGFRYKNFKLEGSNFTGREPDENRYNFDRPRFDSWSARLSYNPTAQWAFQVSRANVKGSHALNPKEDIQKTTASAMHAIQIGPKSFLNSAAVWGYNYSAQHHKEHSALLESALATNNTTIYGRYEWVEKSTEELMLDEETYGHGTVFPVNALTIGVNQNLFKAGNTIFSLGAQGTFYKTDSKLNSLYGKNPSALEVYIRVSPGLMNAGAKR